MPGTELFGAEERKEIEDVLSTGIMFRFNHDAQRNNIWKAKDFEAEAKKITGAKYALAVSNGSAAILAAFEDLVATKFSPDQQEILNDAAIVKIINQLTKSQTTANKPKRTRSKRVASV